MNPIQAFLAARAKGKQAVANAADQPVTRAEFNTLARAVELLIDDVDTATSPDKIKLAINSAFDAAVQGMKVNGSGKRPPLVLPDDDRDERRRALAPKGDEPALRGNAGSRARLAPLALEGE